MMHRLSRGTIIRVKVLCFCIKNYIGTRGEDLLLIKVLKYPVVYATDRSKAVVLVWLCGFRYEAFHMRIPAV